jgi:3-hydroxyisobutyrate dehydrogenase-like beta-hydroxyacid dehydrogenase
MMGGQESNMQISLLGLGNMGVPIAGWLQKSGYPLTLWNRSPIQDSMGATVAATVAEAVKGKWIVFTSLSDDAATAAVTLGPGGILENMDREAIHVSLSTISVDLSKRLTEAHQQRGQQFVAAPVFGRPPVAEQGRLWITVAGETGAVETVRPLLAGFSRGVTLVSDQPWRAHALKLGGNFMIAAMIQSISEATLFAQAHGLDADLFTATVNDALFRSPLYGTYAHVILHPPDTPGATVTLGSKDLGLFREAAKEVGRRLPLADYIAAQLHRAQEAGLEDEEWSVGQFRIADATTRVESGEAGNTGLDIG